METTALFQIVDKLTLTCERLVACLTIEKENLIDYKLEELLQNNVLKESLITELVAQKRELRTILKRDLDVKGVSSVAEKLENSQREQWLRKRLKWERVWGATREAANRNESFIEESSKSLNSITDHLKSLLGMGSVYTDHGKKQDLMAEGTVVEGEV